MRLHHHAADEMQSCLHLKMRVHILLSLRQASASTGSPTTGGWAEADLNKWHLSTNRPSKAVQAPHTDAANDALDWRSIRRPGFCLPLCRSTAEAMVAMHSATLAAQGIGVPPRQGWRLDSTFIVLLRVDCGLCEGGESCTCVRYSTTLLTIH